MLSSSSIPPSESKKLLKIEANLLCTCKGTGSFLGLVDLLFFLSLLLVGSSSMMMSMFGTNFLFVFVSGYFSLIPVHCSDLLRAKFGIIFGDRSIYSLLLLMLAFLTSGFLQLDLYGDKSNCLFGSCKSSSLLISI